MSSLRDSLGFTYQSEDRWLWFALRLSFVLFLVAVQAVLVAAFAKVMLNL